MRQPDLPAAADGAGADDSIPVVPHMTPDEFRRARRRGRRVDRPLHGAGGVAARCCRASRPARCARSCRRTRPSMASPSRRCSRDLDRIVLPGITHWQSPGFFAYFPANSLGPVDPRRAAVGGPRRAGDALAARAPPAPSSRRTCWTGWSRLLGLPAALPSDGRRRRRHPGHGVLGGALRPARRPRARERRRAPTPAAVDGTPHRLRLDAGALVGREGGGDRRASGSDNLRARRRRRGASRCAPSAARQAIDADRAAGSVRASSARPSARPRRTRSTRCRRSREIVPPPRAVAARRRRDERAPRRSAPSSACIHAGVEHADSYCFNPHKWMLTNFDCDAFWVARPGGVAPHALRPAGVPAEPRHRVGRGHRLPRLARAARPPLPRAQALVRDPPLRRRGAAAARSARTSRSRTGFADWVGREPDFELAAPVPLNLVCFRHAAGDEAERAGLLDGAQRLRRAVPHPHPARRPLHAAAVRSAGATPGAPRRAGVAAAARRGGRLTAAARLAPVSRAASARR